MADSDKQTLGESKVSRDVLLSAGKRVLSASNLGSLMRSRRKALGYTQVEVAEMLGCSPRLVAEMEQGRGTVAFERMLAYALNLGIDLVAMVRE